VVTTEFPRLVNDKGELRDEELVRLATSGQEAASVQLMERYFPKIKKIVAGIVYKHGLCPLPQAPSFVEDAAQNVCLKITANLKSYGFEQPFEHWVAAICTNEVLAGRRDTVGRGPLPRVFVSWEDFLQQAPSPVIRNTEHRDILKKAIDKYIEQGRQAKKSWDAIRLYWFEDLDVEEVAVQLNTTTGYVYKMFSHDYRALRRISIGGFGFSGTDL
jgi:RNA polymerase sigma factor (sigma-70 family)